MKRLLDSDPQREAARQARILAVAERVYSARFYAVIMQASNEMAAMYKATGAVPPLPTDHPRRVEAVFYDLASTTVQAFGERILGQGKSLGLVVETKAGFAELFQRLALEWLARETIRQRITSIANTTRNNIVRAVVSGQEAGLGVDEIARNITGVAPALSRYRASVIARTETHGAANYASNEAAKATGLDLQKEWISAEDHRTRDFGEGDGQVDEYDHRSMNGQVVEMDQPFLMPWRYGDPIQCMFPGDPSLPAGAAINCRCTVGHIVKGLD